MDLNNWGAMPGIGGDDYHAFTSTTEGMKTGGGKAKPCPDGKYQPATGDHIAAVLLALAAVGLLFAFFL